MEGFGTGSTVSCPTIRRFRELVEQCYSCTRHSNYSANRAPPTGCERLMCAAIQGGSGGGGLARQRAPMRYSQGTEWDPQEDGGKEQSPPDQSCALNV